MSVHSINLLQEEEYRLRQLLELGPDHPTLQQPEMQLLHEQEEDGTLSADSPDGQNDLMGQGGSMGTGYFDAAGNWQTYDSDADVGTAEAGSADMGSAAVATAAEAAAFVAASQAVVAKYISACVHAKGQHLPRFTVQQSALRCL